MRFMPARDYQTVIDINKELINTVIDTVVVLYKINVLASQTNIYDEAPKKVYYNGVRIPCLIGRDQITPTLDGNVVSQTQSSWFAFLRQELDQRGIYPEAGDIIDFNDDYYEIYTANETQLIAGQTAYNHAILCYSILVRIPAAQLQAPEQ